MDRLDQLMQDLLKPTYVYRMAPLNVFNYSERLQKSAETRRKNVKKEIHDLILDYIADVYPDAQLDG